MDVGWYKRAFSHVDRMCVADSLCLRRCRLKIRQVVFLLLASALFLPPALAQSPNGTMSGRVVDSSGAVIVGAQVLIVNEATGIQYPTKTNAEGIYVVPNLPPGLYLLQVSRIGFKTIIKPDIILSVQGALAINFTLPVGAASVTVTVQGGAPLVNTQSAAVSTVINRQFVENLPLNGRSFNTLLQLTPGVVIAPVSASGLDPGQFSVAGQRTSANNFTVDGVSANFGVGSALTVGGSGTGTAQAFSALGGTSSLVSVDDLQEFRVETSSFAPQFGRSPGGQVILTTRSGTNRFHGSVFDYFRNTVMDANDWFANREGLPRAAEHHNDFGGVLGGPIWKNKTFFFASYEGARLDLPQTHLIQVPSAYARAQAPAALAPYLNAYPKPNGQPTSPTAYFAPFTASFSNTASLDAGSIRIDHTFGNGFSLFGRYNDAPSGLTNLGVTIPSNPENIDVNTQTLTVGLNMALSPRLSNAFRGNYSRQSSGSAFVQDSFGGAVPLDPHLLSGSLSSATTLAEFVTLDTFEGYFLGRDATNQSKQLNFVDDLSWTRGTHQLKFGADYRAIFLDKTPFRNELLYQASSVQDFLSTGQATLEAGTAARAQLLTQALSLYGQDTWQATRRLTLVYGLRWEFSPAPSERGATSLAAWTNVNNPATLALAQPGTPPWKTTYDNFAPRLGLAYRLSRNGDFVLRVGGGIFYDLAVDQIGQLATSFPNFAFGNPAAVALPLADPTPYLAPLSPKPPYPNGTAGYAPNLQLPRSYQWNVALEKSFGGTQAISATYVGQVGNDLLRQQALYQPNANFAGDFLLWQNDAHSNYNALELQYRRPLSSHLQALANYTWSHSLDNASNDVVAALSKAVLSGASDYASSDFDVRQSFSAAITYAIPGVRRNVPFSVLTRDWSLALLSG